MKLTFLLIFFFVTSCATPDKTRKSNPSEAKFPGFSVTLDSHSPDPEAIHFENKDRHHIFLALLMDNLNNQEAERLFQYRQNYLKGLFHNNEDPYFGKSSRSKDCVNNLNLDGVVPLISEDFKATTFNVPATEHFVLGQCNPEVEFYSSQITFLFCKKTHQFFEIKYFRPKNSKPGISPDLAGICEVS
jgi:hypothetical protein